jgi:hypothetical protein
VKYLHLIILPLLLSSCLPDNDDHTSCAPEGEDDYLVSEEIYSTTISLRDSEPQEVFYELKDGMAITEGDIAIGRIGEDFGAVGTTGQLWSERVVHFKIHPDLPDKDRVYEAIKIWEEATDRLIVFYEIDTAPNYIEFIVADGCWSYIGQRGGRQPLGLAKGCVTRNVVHEIGHVLGLWHEQSRHDRDSFVEIKWCNIAEKKSSQFQKGNRQRF